MCIWELERSLEGDRPRSFLSVCPGSCHNRMLYSIACGYRFYHRLCLAVVEDHSDYAAFFSVFILLRHLCIFHCLPSLRSSWSLPWWIDQLSHFAHQKVGKNTCELPIQMFSVGLGASMFTFVKTCVERYGL
jgi:hypothetical protein